MLATLFLCYLSETSQEPFDIKPLSNFHSHSHSQSYSIDKEAKSG